MNNSKKGRPPGPKTVKRFFSSTPAIEEMVERLMEKWGSFSYSEAVRRAISETHFSEKPLYLEKSIAQLEKEKKAREEMEKRAAWDSITPEQYVSDIQGIIIPTSTGNDFAVIRAFGNSLRGFPLSKIKEALKEKPIFLSDHEEQMEKWGPINPKNTKSHFSHWKIEYDIIFPDEETVTNQPTDSTNSETPI